MKYWYVIVEISANRLGSQESTYYGVKFENEEFLIAKAIEIFKGICKETRKNAKYELNEKYFNAIISWDEISEAQHSELGTRRVN